MEKMMKEMGDRMMAQRSSQGGPGAQAGAAPQGEGAQQQQARPAGQGQGAPTGGRFAGGLAGGQRRQQPSRVWVLDKDGKLRMIFIRPGLTDNTYTEVLRSDLKEGEEVITGTESAVSAANRTQQQGGPGRGMMFIGR